MNIRKWNCWNWSGPRVFGLVIGIIGMVLIGHFSSWWVTVGLFLWSWSQNIDNSNL